MIRDRRILFRLQAGNRIGGGHLARCMTLADELSKLGAKISFWCNEEAWEFDSLRSSDFKRFNETSLGNNNFDLAIIDDYAMASQEDNVLRSYANKIMVIDDLANRSHDCDILLDFSPGRTDKDYKKLVNDHCLIFTGLDYIILRPEFFEMALQPRKIERVKNVFISMGSIDGARLLPSVLSELELSDEILSLHVMVTHKTKTLEELKRSQELSKHNINIHQNVRDPATIMSSCDLAISAGGMTLLELVCIGIPTFMFIVADNQIENVTTLENLGFSKMLNKPQDILPTLQKYNDHKLKFGRPNIGHKLKIIPELEKILN